MPIDEQTGVRRPSREVRLGVVMYGGVSLAIYINGVTREMFRAVHGNGVYKVLKRLIDADIALDIVSGTSAGGINGIFLAYALANRKDFAVIADLWTNDSDIRKLLRDPENLPEDVNSVLDSEGFYQPALEKAFAAMDRTPYDNTKDEPSPFGEIDLFVTGTNIDGNVYTVHDDSGHLIDVKDHSAVFQLKHRPDRKEPFNAFDKKQYSSPAVAHRALAKLGRLTSSFPAAFAPTKISGPKNPPDDAIEAEADKQLRLWGALKHAAYFLDGGVLDNKPFTYTIRDMAYRLKDREIERFLIYVEPDPEGFEAQKQNQENEAVKPPTFGRGALAGALSIPGYESIATI